MVVASDTEAVLYEKRDGKAYITLNRPRALNAYNIAMRDGLYQVLGAVRDDPDVRVVVLRGAGDRAFCAGADLTEFLTAESPTLARKARWDRDVWGLFLSIEKPMFAALHGFDGDGPGTIKIFQDIVLPPGTTTLQFDYRGAWEV